MTPQATNKSIFKYLLWIIFLIILFKDTLTGYPFNSSISTRYIEDSILLILYFWMGYDLIKRSRIPQSTQIYLYSFTVILILHAAQTMAGIDQQAIFKYIFTLRDNFWFFPILYFSIRYLESNDLIRIITAFIAIQIFFVSLQVLYHGAIYRELLWEDEINGSLGANASHILAYSLILTAPAILTRNKKIIILVTAAIVILASARSAIIFSAIAFPLFFLMRKFNLHKTISTVAVFLIVVIPAYNFLNDKFDATLDPSVLFDQQRKELGEGIGAARLSFLMYSINKVDTAEEMLLGHGPASYSSRSALTLSGREYNKFSQEFRFENEFITGGSTYNSWIVEHGYIATIIFTLIFLYPVYTLRKYWYASACFLVLFLGISVQKLMESYAIGFLYWVVLAYFLLKKREQNHS